MIKVLFNHDEQRFEIRTEDKEDLVLIESALDRASYQTGKEYYRDMAREIEACYID